MGIGLGNTNDEKQRKLESLRRQITADEEVGSEDEISNSNWLDNVDVSDGWTENMHQQIEGQFDEDWENEQAQKIVRAQQLQ